MDAEFTYPKPFLREYKDQMRRVEYGPDLFPLSNSDNPSRAAALLTALLKKYFFMKNVRLNQSLIETCRKEIIKLSQSQDAIYKQMVAIIGTDDDYLWDYCFNCHNEDDYTNRVREELYGSNQPNNQ